MQQKKEQVNKTLTTPRAAHSQIFPSIVGRKEKKWWLELLKKVISQSRAASGELTLGLGSFVHFSLNRNVEKILSSSLFPKPRHANLTNFV